MVELRLYVEGGGDAKLLRTACRQGFSEFLKRAGLAGHMPRIVASGGRRQAYDDFCTALGLGHHAMLLVDSEAPVDGNSPWAHLRQRRGDGWPAPARSTDEDCHLMVQCMENWFLADRATLQRYFGQGYRAAALPASTIGIERVPKSEVLRALEEATSGCKTKTRYAKGEHSFKLLAEIDPGSVASASPWALRLVSTLKRRMGA